ncbi:ATP-grasp domain-containing protein [Hazenella sp. IB182357]|uniref:ATP-grasp domain-containing protein n=1 Tax=Polycladospora coralii TaxID=2771432 RepID=A0A926NAC6_9BACL|nr:ATP-grasp domain-containing protein [Polycladospora coralii]MBD1372847.1 ATP-grasp domain-containing protein [Polycladospora coralii]MBS7529464.1 ATP-grasp domain-containing protein [Polycladospora coralii]
MGFEAELKDALVQDQRVKFIYLNNFEVEESWSDDHLIKLPQLTLGSGKTIVNRMEEMGIFLASSSDYIVLKDAIDPDYLQALRDHHFSIPHRIVLTQNNPEQTITENLLEDEETLSKLRELGTKERVFFLPFGVSEAEEKLAEVTGIPLATPSSSVFKKVNSKIYSRQLNEQLGLAQIRGINCESIDSLKQAFNELKPLLADNRKLVLKDALGVSGKGIVIIESERRFMQTLKLLENRSKKANGNQKVAFVLEEWIDKVCDLNYQFLISRDGQVHFHFVKEALTHNGVHQGHLIPSRLTAEQVTALAVISKQIGEALYKDGYFGIVGVDAILDQQNKIWPNLEINARFNMSTYQTRIQEERMTAEQVALVKQYPLKLKYALSYQKIAAYLSTYLYQVTSGKGFLICNFATVNAAYIEEGKPFSGRLYGMIIAENVEELKRLDEEISYQLKQLLEEDQYAQGV